MTNIRVLSDISRYINLVVYSNTLRDRSR